MRQSPVSRPGLKQASESDQLPMPQDAVADSRVVSFYSNATVYQATPINPTPNAEVRIFCKATHRRQRRPH